MFLQQLQNPFLSMAAQMHAVAQNVFNFIAVVDLASSKGLALAAAMGEMMADEYPVRIGLLPVMPPGEKAATAFIRTVLEALWCCSDITN